MSLKKNLDQLVFEQMKDRIINGDWEQGRILDVDELSAYYEVSRTPILQALKRMQNEGMLVVSRVGKFYFPNYNEQQVRNICRIRLILEAEALDEIQQNKPSMDWRALRDLTQWCQRRTICGDVVASRRYDMEWHKHLVDASENECLIGLYLKVQGQFMIANYLQTSHSNAQQKVAADDHTCIMDHLELGDYAGAKEVLALHINNACTKILARAHLCQAEAADG